MHVRPTRQAERVACRFPLRFALGGAWLEARVCDLSRTGVRLRIPVDRLVEMEGRGLLDLVRLLCDALPPRLAAEFHPERLGSLISRTVHVVRLAVHGGPDPEVEIGGQLDLPLTDVDVAALDIPLPGAGAPTPLEDPPVPPRRGPRRATVGKPRPAADGRDHLLAEVRSTARRAAPPLRTTVYDLDERGVVIALPPCRQPAGSTDGPDLGAVLLDFCESYGARVELRLRQGERDLWRGVVRAEAVESVAGSEDELRLGLGFGRTLGTDERAALSLA